MIEPTNVKLLHCCCVRFQKFQNWIFTFLPFDAVLIFAWLIYLWSIYFLRVSACTYCWIFLLRIVYAGVIILYRLYHNGLLAYNGSSLCDQTISSLQPWSIHIFREEACTIRGCAQSDDLTMRTQEAPPVGAIGLQVRVNNARGVSAYWTAVDSPNGLLYYNVYFNGIFYNNPGKYVALRIYYSCFQFWWLNALLVVDVNLRAKQFYYRFLIFSAANDYNVTVRRRSLYLTLLSPDYSTWIKIDGLIPYSNYSVQVNGSNTRGYILSNVVEITMPMSGEKLHIECRYL